MDFLGTWNIYKMEMWDEDYFNMEVQAYIKINDDKTGEFQFGLVQGELDGRIVRNGKKKKFEFTFEGNDENDPISGRGWIILKSKDEIEGEFIFHLGDSSLFNAKMAV